MEQENPCLCIQELKLLLMIAYLYAMDEKYEEEKCILQWVESYVEAHFQDEEEKVKIYPHCEYLLAQLYDILGEQEKSRQYCINGKECLIKNGSLVLMKEYLKLEEAYYEQSGQADHVQICQRQIEAIAMVNSIVQLQEETPILLSLLEESIQRECVLSNEVIRELRLAYQWTQEQLSEDICAQETLARIEKGHRSPNKKKYYSMLERMGLERKKYYGFIYADDYQLYEKVRLYNRSISVSNWEKAGELLQEIADGTDMDIPVNRQFVGDAMIHQKLRKKEMTYEQAIEQLKELLYLTMPPTKSEKLVYRVPFRTEYSILNQMALCYGRNGRDKEEAKIYQQIMERYKNSKCPMTFHEVPGFTLFVNYTGSLEDIDKVEEAERIGIEGVEHSVLCGRGDTVGQILGNLTCVYMKQNKPELAKQYLRSAYYLFVLYRRKRNQEIAKEAYQNYFKETINYCHLFCIS